jgi:SAM-dependent methyltransferase
MTYYLDNAGLDKEIERLEWNHYNTFIPTLYRGKFFPQHIQKYLDGLPRDRTPAIADVATGTGVWLLEIAPKLPPSSRLDGFDISTAKFRPKDKLPANVKLQCGDARSPFPEELHGQYDVVHVRLVVLALKADEWAKVAANLLPLLRPGGWLFWEETSMTSWNSIPMTKAFHEVVSVSARFEISRGRNLL